MGRKKTGKWDDARKERWMKARWGKSKTASQNHQKGAENNPISPQTGGTTGQ